MWRKKEDYSSLCTRTACGGRRKSIHPCVLEDHVEEEERGSIAEVRSPIHPVGWTSQKQLMTRYCSCLLTRKREAALAALQFLSYSRHD
jgi:hypothetical protein